MKKSFAQENAKKVVERLGTGLFDTVTNVTPHSCGCGEILLGNFFLITCAGFDATCKRSEKTFSVPRYISQHAMEIFLLKWKVVSDISKVLLNDILKKLMEAVGSRK